MLGTSRSRLLFFFSVAASGTGALVSACTDETANTPAADGDASADGARPARDSGGSGEDDDGSVDPNKDAGATDARSGKDANGPGEAGAECNFNRDCQAALRCECENGSCSCQPGARGTGKSGVDACTSGNDCESSVCVEGPSGSFCSDECTTNADCTGKLPVCLPIVGLPEAICSPEESNN